MLPRGRGREPSAVLTVPGGHGTIGELTVWKIVPRLQAAVVFSLCGQFRAVLFATG